MEQNLNDLCDSPMPDEPMSAQLWMLLRIGFDKKQLVSTINVLAEAPWTTMVAEQQHSSLARLRAWHPEYSASALVSHALALQLRRLLPAVSDTEKKIQRLRASLDRVLAKNPEKASGRHIYVKDLMDHLRDRNWTHTRREVPVAIRNIVFKRHAMQWARQSLEVRRDYEYRAKLAASTTRASLEEEAATIRAQRDLLLSQLEENQGQTKPILMSEASFEPAHLELFSTLFDGRDFRGVRLESLRTQALAVADPMTAHTKASLERQEVWRCPHPQMPRWASQVAAAREYFSDVVLVLAVALEDITYWKVVYCAQSPLYVAVSRLALRDEYTDVHAVARASWDGPPVDKYKFRCNFANNGSAADMPYVEENQLFVIPHARHTDGMHMASPCDTVPLGLFVSQLLVAQKAEVEGAKAKRASKATDELIDAYPWLADLDDREGFSEHIPSESCGSASSGHGDRAREDVVLDEDAVEQAMRELDEVRAGLAAHEPRESEADFKTSVSGGQWLLAERGLACDAIQGSARGALANDFCARRGVQKSIRFDLAAYGHEACGIMARAWCHKMQFYLNAELGGRAEENLPFEANVHDAYAEPTEFVRLCASPDATSRAMARRIAQIRALLRAA